MVKNFAGGATIRRLREARGLTQEALAKKAKVSYSYVSKLESAARTTVSESVIAQLARALRVDPLVFSLTPEQAVEHLAALALAEKREAASA